MSEPTLEQMEAAIARIGKTTDGKMLRASLIQRLLRVLPGPASESALREDAAERSFAQRLIRQLDSEVTHAERPDDSTARPLSREPIALAGRRSWRRVGPSGE